MSAIEFEAPVRIDSVNRTRDRHWSIRKRKTDEQRRAVFYAFCASGYARTFRPRNRRVTLTRIAPRRIDDDNCIAGMKAVRDEVANILGVDDGDPSVEWRYAQERGKPNHYAARIRIESSDETALDNAI